MAEILIKNGIVVTAEKEWPADISLSGEIISAVAPGLPVPAGAEIIDAKGLFIFPGGVDAHTHLDLTVGRNRVSDGWLSGTMAAAFGGTTCVIEHPGFAPPGSTLDYQLNLYRRNAVESVIDYGLHGVFQRWDEGVKKELAAVVAGGYPSFKAYMTYDGRLEDKDLLAALKSLKEAGALMTVHAESHAIINALTADLGKSAPSDATSWPLSRPAYAEALAISTAICLAETAGGAPLYIAHLSTAEGLEIIRKAKAAGKKVWAETCPQYLLLTGDSYRGDFENALKVVMAPPLRQKKDVEALWEGLFDGAIDTVATDHCSFAWQGKIEKASGNVFKCPGGIPGVETRLPLLYSEGVIKRGLDRKKYVELLSAKPAALFGLKKKGDIKAGLDADLVIFDPGEERKITASRLHQAVDYSPFEDMIIRGWPKMVFSRGERIIDQGRFLGKLGRGKFIRRQLFSSPGQGPGLAAGK